MSTAPSGFFETEAPIDHDTLVRHRVELEKWLGRLPEGIVIRDAEVWVEGVVWRYRKVDARGFDG